jgi:hypothetical protein
MQIELTFPEPMDQLSRHITNPDLRFKFLCDAAMDLNPDAISGKVPHDSNECAHLIALADASASRECANAAKQLTSSSPNQVVYILSGLHSKITNYLFVRAMILGIDPYEDEEDDEEIGIF